MKISPRARRLARDLGVEMEALSALGKSVIREEDVRAVAAERDAQAATDSPAVEETPDLLAAFAQSEAAALPKQVPPLTVTGEPYLPAMSETVAPPDAADGAAAPEAPPAPAPPEETAPDDFEVLAEGALSETGRQGDGETGGRGDAETRRRGDAGTRGGGEEAAKEPDLNAQRSTLNAHTSLTSQEPELLPLSPIRRVIADRALASVREVPQFPLWIDVDTGTLLRETGGDALRGTAAWVQAVARTLEAHPRLNATFTTEGILLHRAVHVGVTLPLEDGIVVPVLHDAGRKSLEELAEELRDLEERARTRRLRGEHLAGATFSLADWSAFGVRGGVPLIHPPQVAALGIGVPREVPLIRDGGLFVRTTSEAVLVSDQRALDAAHAAAFLTALKHHVER